MCGGYGAKVCGTVYQLLHLCLGILVSLTAFGVFKLVARAGLMDISDVCAQHFIQPGNLVHLILQCTVAFVHAVEKPIGDAVLHTVELILVGNVCDIDDTVGLSRKFLLVKFLDP